jgi:transglutaminase-like putative cysteine protease
MRQYVETYKTHPRVRELALQLTRALPQKDFAAEIDTLFRFVQTRIRYVRDVHNVETIQTPVKTLEYGQGDCDDKTTLLAALLQSLGHPTRFHAMGFRPGHVEHVLLEVKRGTQWIPLDATEPHRGGWAPPALRHSLYG